MSSPPLGPLFAPTRWSLVHRAQGGSPASRAALAELCEAYWQPVFQVLRRSGRTEEASREACQEFFAYLLSGGRLDGANAQRGRFRSYLLGALRHFESDQRKRSRRLKRGGGLSPDALASSDPPEPETPPWEDHEFDREWALAVVTRALSTVEGEYATPPHRSRLFERLKPSLAGGELPPHAVLAQELAITEGAVKVAIHRLRRRFREVVKTEIAQTVHHAPDAEAELRYLVEVLSRG